MSDIGQHLVLRYLSYTPVASQCLFEASRRHPNDMNEKLPIPCQHCNVSGIALRGRMQGVPRQGNCLIASDEILPARTDTPERLQSRPPNRR
jgi:hypothetical protein